MKILNAFSINMLAPGLPCTVTFNPVTEQHVMDCIRDYGLESCIGHDGTAEVLSRRLGRVVPVNRVNARLERSEWAIVAQVTMPRLDEGKVLSAEEIGELSIRYWMVMVI